MSLTAVLAAIALAAAAPSVSPPPSGSPTQAAAQAEAVTFTRRTIPDGDVAIEVGVWRPTEVPADVRLPLIVISHGNGGDYRGHEDTARALAAAGFIVASLTHTGDNWRDQSRATDVALRPRQLSLLIEAMVQEPDVDPNRVGAFGFSAGALTVLTAAGAEPDLSRIAAHCQSHPAFYDCQLIAARGVPASRADTVWTHNARIRAVVAAAPALGFTLTPERLAAVTQPVQLWRGENDRVLPSPFYVEPVRDGLPRPPEVHTVPGAGHFDFLPPCSAQLAANAPMICAPTPGFDRAAFHETFNREIVRFFRRTLVSRNP